MGSSEGCSLESDWAIGEALGVLVLCDQEFESRIGSVVARLPGLAERTPVEKDETCVLAPLTDGEETARGKPVEIMLGLLDTVGPFMPSTCGGVKVNMAEEPPEASLPENADRTLSKPGEFGEEEGEMLHLSDEGRRRHGVLGEGCSCGDWGGCS